MLYNIIGRLALRVRNYIVNLQPRMNKIAAHEHCRMGENVALLGNASVINCSGNLDSIRIGSRCVILAELMVFTGRGQIEIGEDTYIGPGSHIMAFDKIQVGSRVQISHGVNIYDNNSHSLSAGKRFEHMKQILGDGHPKTVDDVPCSPVVIEDDVWIGFGACIMKGVRIGRGAVVGAGSMVTKDVPPYKVVVGRPQREVGDSRP